MISLHSSLPISQISQVKTANPEFTPTEVMTKLGSLWKALSDEDKAPFLAEAKKDKQRYADEMKSYVPPITSSASASRPPSKKRKSKGQHVA